MRFEDMNIWKRSARLSANIYKYFATCKDFGFKDQITRASLSIPSNIAEGAERDYSKDFIRFLKYSKGSCGELRTQIFIGIDIEYINKEVGNEWIKETYEISKMLAGFINSIKNSDKLEES